MRRALSSAVVMTMMVAAACGDPRPPVSSGATGPRNDAAATPEDGGEERDGGLDGAVDGDAADPLACPPVAGEALPAAIVCRPDATWSSPVPVVFSDGADALATVSADERTVAWFHVGGPSPVLLVADRPDVASPFGASRAVSPDGGMFGTRAALSPDGLQLVVVGPDRRHLVALTRTALGEPFAAAEEGSADGVAFAQLNADLADLPDDDGVDDPVWSRDGVELLFSVASLDGTTIHAAKRQGSAAFSVPTALADCELASRGVGRSRRPTGMSADGLTLFYFDEARKLARAAFRATRTAPFSVFVDLGERAGAQPNATCDALWSLRAPAGGSSEIVRETR
jgi:hypothetical protein